YLAGASRRQEYSARKFLQSHRFYGIIHSVRHLESSLLNIYRKVSSMNSLILLGTGTCQIEYERRASSVLIQLDAMPVLFDCGHGVVQRLLEVGIQHN